MVILASGHWKGAGQGRGEERRKQGSSALDSRKREAGKGRGWAEALPEATLGR